MFFVMQTFIDKFRYNAKRASLVQSRIKVRVIIILVDDFKLKSSALLMLFLLVKPTLILSFEFRHWTDWVIWMRLLMTPSMHLSSYVVDSFLNFT